MDKGYIIVYDDQVDGNGTSQLLFESLRKLFTRLEETLSSCTCLTSFGCPKCLQMMNCPQKNKNLDKNLLNLALQSITSSKSPLLLGNEFNSYVTTVV